MLCRKRGRTVANRLALPFRRPSSPGRCYSQAPRFPAILAAFEEVNYSETLQRLLGFEVIDHRVRWPWNLDRSLGMPGSLGKVRKGKVAQIESVVASSTAFKAFVALFEHSQFATVRKWRPACQVTTLGWTSNRGNLLSSLCLPEVKAEPSSVTGTKWLPIWSIALNRLVQCVLLPAPRAEATG